MDLPGKDLPIHQAPIPVAPVVPEKQSPAGVIALIAAAALISIGSTAYIVVRFDKRSDTGAATAQEAQPARQEETETTANLTTYTNAKFGYTFSYPSEWVMTSMSPGDDVSGSPSVNLRLKSDRTPAESGVAVLVTDNPSGVQFKEWLVANPDNGTFRRAAGDIRESFVFKNSINWERIDGDSVSVVPTGNVIYAASRANSIYTVVAYNNDPETLSMADTVIRHFTIAMP